MIGNVHVEVLLAAGYALFLVLAAVGLECFGRHSHRRSGQFRTASFRYQEHLDVWECPCGHHLHRLYHDPVQAIVRYRAPAHTCNACLKKPDCTDSDQGREIALSSVPWIKSEAGRFHRGISLALLMLAAFILTVEMFRHRSAVELLVIGGVLAPIATAGLRLIREFRAAPEQLESSSLPMNAPKITPAE